ncbi:MAG: LUD domain-containing protein [Planctomycetaceae bacterium]|jgi:L-lactate dehydrogenase complex protein LldG|nr:LUD domain-containing protein [Planctomycetaceae bacterium]
MATKQAILDKVRSAISDAKNSVPVIPPPPKVWDIEGLSAAEMNSRFETNLKSVGGQFVSCTDFQQAVDGIRALLHNAGAKKVAVMDRPLCRRIAERLPEIEWVFPPDDAANITAADLAQVDAGLVLPEYLLSDTGSCVFSAPAAFDRLITYITPVSVVVAEKPMLRENLPALWQELEPQLKTAATGEFVFVTGPSRTADIEKILVLGVHGPKTLAVFLID